VRIEIIDVAERIEPLLPLLEPMIGEGLLTILDVRIRRYLHDPKP
jgi:PII-like signaling protein